MPPPSVLGAVEVQKDVGSKMWYCGHIVDVVRGEAVMVTFEGDVWPQQQFQLSSVRKTPKVSPAELEKFNPRVGDEVELRINATEHTPAGWATAVVRNIKQSFYFVARSSSVGSSEAIVEKEMLRPVSTGAGLAPVAIKRETFEVKPELHSWLTTTDAVGCLSHIEELAGLLYIQTLGEKLLLVGEAKAVKKATMLLEVHVKHQAEIQRFQDMREKRLRALETKRNRIQGTGYKHSVEVKVDPGFIKRIIGKGGEVIKALEEKYSVSVRIVEDDGGDEERVVRIFGNSPENLEKARTEVEFVEEALPVQPDQYSWILGRKGVTIQNFRDNCNLVYATLDREGQQLRLCGTRQAVQDAMAMFETHLMYFPVVHQMDEEMDQILGQLEEYGDWNARWEWGWYRDEEPDLDKGGNKWGGGWNNQGGKAKGGGGKSKDQGGWNRQDEWNNWKNWDEEEDRKGKKKNSSWSGESKDDKGDKNDRSQRRSKGKSKGWKVDESWNEEHGEQEESLEEEKKKVTPPREAGKGKGKAGKAGWSYKPKEEVAEVEKEEEEEQEEEESYEAPGGGRYVPRGRGGRRQGTSAGQGSGRGAASGERQPPTQRMGKKGLRY